MPTSTTPSDPTGTAADRKPRDDELDLFGLTHPGKVRRENQDHFLYCTLHKTMRVGSTSLSTPELLELPSERLASFAMVADGVGGSAGGETASRATIETVATFATHTMQVYYGMNAPGGEGFLEALRAAAQLCHEQVLARARAQPDSKKMATTLTMFMIVWPQLYVLHVGDSRCYRLRGGVLERLTRDQTMAQDLVDKGALNAETAARSPFANVLSSAIGDSSHPEVGEFVMQKGDVMLLYTDGLTRHVPDDRIRERLIAMLSSEQVCRQLVEDALAGGGHDNITVYVGRAVLKP